MKDYSFVFEDKGNKFRVIRIDIGGQPALTYLNTETGKILDFCFQEALVVRDGYAQVATRESCYYFNPETGALSKPFDTTYMMQNGYGVGCKNAYNYYLYDAKNNKTINKAFKSIHNIADDMAAVDLLEEDGVSAVYDIKTGQVLPERFSATLVHSRKLVEVRLLDKSGWTLYNPTTHEVLDKKFEGVSIILDGVYVKDKTQNNQWHKYDTPWFNKEEENA